MKPEPRTSKDLMEVLKMAFNISENSPESEGGRFVIYARKSTDASEKQERSLDDQLYECNEKAVQWNLNVVKRIVEKASAKEPDIRPNFREMLDSIIKGKYDSILAWHPDRLARNMKDAGEILDLLDKGIIKDLKFVSYTFENNAGGKMLLGLSFAIAKQFSDKLSDDVKRGMRRSIEEGRWLTTAKHGYYKDKNQMLWPDDENYTLIKAVFDMRLASGKTLNELVTFLVKNGYPVKTKNGQRRQQVINIKLVSEILRDPFYAGVSIFGDSVVDLPSG